MEILATSQQIRDKIRWVLGDAHDERVALVAFVGNDAAKFLANPKGIQLYCWLKVPGTNPNGLRNLRSKGVDLFAVNNLHMKLYWSRKRGAVLGSANLSKNALGNSSQFELAVYFPLKTIDIKRLTRRFVAAPIDDLMIDKFEKKYNLYHLRNQDEYPQYLPNKSQVPSYLKWRELRRKSKETQFRLYWWWEVDNPPRDALQVVKRETGSEEYHNFMNSWSKNNYKQGEWVLAFRALEDENIDLRRLRLEWFIPQVYARTKNKRWSGVNHIWFQIGKQLPAVPFNLEDPFLKQALKDVLINNACKVENLVKNGTQPTEEFLLSLEQRYREITRARE